MKNKEFILSEHLTSSSEATLGHSNKLDGSHLSPHLTSSSEATLGHSNKLDGSHLSPHFTLGELTKTNTGLKNVPNEEQVNNLRRVCRWLERLRQKWNDIYGDGDDPLVITSGFRSPKVNKAVGGSPTSNHMKGCAVDICCIGPEQTRRYALLLIDISREFDEDFDEILIERNDRCRWWLHFAVRPKDNRRHMNFIR